MPKTTLDFLKLPAVKPFILWACVNLRIFCPLNAKVSYDKQIVSHWYIKHFQYKRPYSARAAGSHEEGTSCLTWLDSVIWDLSSSMLYRAINQPSNARLLVAAASFCQHPLKLNVALNNPDGILPDKDISWLNCSDIWHKLADNTQT